MTLARVLLARCFSHPRGLLGRIGGLLMARMNAPFGRWVVELLTIAPQDRVLEIGFGPGVIVQHLAALTPAGHVAGIDPSVAMLAQARARNETAIADGRMTLQRGSADRLPFDGDRFDAVLAINTMQLWPDVERGLVEIGRVLRPSGRLALGFTKHSGQSDQGLVARPAAVGFENAALVTQARGLCVLATKPRC
jgi:ubiquinone/menaquinone biosynthesis C-methylase UbiE